MIRRPPRSTLFPYTTLFRSLLQAGPQQVPVVVVRFVALTAVDDDPPNPARFEERLVDGQIGEIDRKSTRLNSSHSQISYAVFCLKKKKSQCTTSACDHTSIV